MPKKDFSQVAFAVVQRATGEAAKAIVSIDAANFSELRKAAGKKGGENRAAKLPREKITAIARKAAEIRWKSKRDEDAEKKFPPLKKKHIGA